MDNTHHFGKFSKQSPKGIVVIYGNLLYKVFKTTWVLLFILLRQFLKLSEEGVSYVYLGIVVVLGLLLFRAYLVYKNFQFKIANNQFILKQGIFKKSNTSISFDRIQNINFKQNLIQQLINVYQVNIETAGSKKIEIAIKALSFEKAEALKKQISLNAVIDAVPLKGNTPLLKISFLELLKVSLTENHLQSLLIFVALLIGIYQQIKDVFKSFGRTDNLKTYLDEGTQVLYGNIILFAFLFIVLLMVGLIGSFVRIFFSHFNLSVFVKHQSFEINQGLTTKKTIVLKKGKIQNITVSTNPIKEKLGISFITFKQAVSGKVAKKKNKLIRIIGCKTNQVIKIKELLFNFKKLESEEKNLVDSYYKTKMYFRSSLMIVLFNIIIYINTENIRWFFSIVILLPIMVLLIRLKFKKAFYKLNDDLLIIGNGRVETHITYLEIFKVQNIKMKQNVFQARKRVVDLVFQTAAGKIKIPCIKRKKALEIYNYTLYKVESSTELWM